MSESIEKSMWGKLSLMQIFLLGSFNKLNLHIAKFHTDLNKLLYLSKWPEIELVTNWIVNDCDRKKIERFFTTQTHILLDDF